MVTVNNDAVRHFQVNLESKAGQAAREYLSNRGVTGESIKTFGLGYALDDWNDLSEKLRQQGYSMESLKTAGLVKQAENKERYYDLFRHRIIFPIHQAPREVVGFGGRTLSDASPKYLNTAETELFSKRRNLYGLVQARDSIRENNSAFLVEGYMDCIKLHQAGIKNVVASLGTALTEEQARLLRRYAEKAIVLYDGDEAGQRESLRAIEVLRKAELKIQVVSLPPGKDPDEFIDSYGKEGFWSYIQNNGCSDIEFKLNRYIGANPQLTLENRISIINQLKPDITGLSSALEKDHYAKLLAKRLKVAENVVEAELNIAQNRTAGYIRNNNGKNRDNNRYVKYGIHEKILAAMFRDQRVFSRIKHEIGLDFWANPDYQTLVEIYDQLTGDGSHRLNELGQNALVKGLESTWARIAMIMDEPNPFAESEIDEFIIRIKLGRSEYNLQKLLKQIKSLEEQSNFESLLTFILSIDKYNQATREGGIQ
jgi:DNA primase